MVRAPLTEHDGPSPSLLQDGREGDVLSLDILQLDLVGARHLGRGRSTCAPSRANEMELFLYLHCHRPAPSSVCFSPISPVQQRMARASSGRQEVRVLAGGAIAYPGCRAAFAAVRSTTATVGDPGDPGAGNALGTHHTVHGHETTCDAASGWQVSPSIGSIHTAGCAHAQQDQEGRTLLT
eukprot:COSAG01_NODE_5413_length_4278_cov_33.242881_2_plen_181_part_00